MDSGSSNGTVPDGWPALEMEIIKESNPNHDFILLCI
jgi:hypothetical protein